MAATVLPFKRPEKQPPKAPPPPSSWTVLVDMYGGKLYYLGE